MLGTKFQLSKFSYTISVTQFQLPNFSDPILFTQFQLHNFSYKIIVKTFKLQNFSYKILVTQILVTQIQLQNFTNVTTVSQVGTKVCFNNLPINQPTDGQTTVVLELLRAAKNPEKPQKVWLFLKVVFFFAFFPDFFRKATLQRAEVFLCFNQCIKTLHLGYQTTLQHGFHFLPYNEEVRFLRPPVGGVKQSFW